MAYIKDIRFDYVDRKDGLICDRCGAYIRNIYTVTYSDGLVARYGMECFKKLFDAGKLTDFGRKLMMKALKRLKEAYETREKWLSVNTLEEAEKNHLNVFPFKNYEAWKGHTFEEYKDFWVNEEKGFTASEFTEAQKEGWEKQYRYKAEKKKIYLTPSAAQKKGYERVDKHPKSTRYGRQNPISEKWNSDEQLCLWRANWADTVNRELECRQIDTRIDIAVFPIRALLNSRQSTKAI